MNIGEMLTIWNKDFMFTNDVDEYGMTNTKKTINRDRRQLIDQTTFDGSKAVYLLSNAG